ncbi:MAG TPA: hypothetical protein PL033_16975, partial [Candidatus Brocadiia bacterium]|nr:hypothetical protein [Candidatus Brocadiia bacterium]
VVPGAGGGALISSQSANLTAVLNDINAGQGFSFGSLHAVGAMKIDTDEKGNSVMAIRDRCLRWGDQVVAPTFAILAYIQQREQPTGPVTWSAEGGSTGIYRFADIDAQYGDVFALFGLSGIGEILSAIGYTIPPGATDLAIAAFKEPEKTVIKVAATVKGEEITEEIAFYCIRLEITKPNLLRSGAPPVYFETTPPYRYDNQGVTSVSPGPYNLPFRHGCAPFAFQYRWGLTAGAGEILVDIYDDPAHVSPQAAGQGVLSLNPVWRRQDGTTLDLAGSDFVDARQIVIFQDHLARDTANFQQGRQCFGGVELPDGTIVTLGGGEGGISCKMAAAHAYDGTIGEPWGGWRTEIYDISNPAGRIQTMSLKRGDVISYGNNINNVTGHWETVIEPGKTYAADSAGKVFLRDTPFAYAKRYDLQYAKLWHNPVNDEE